MKRVMQAQSNVGATEEQIQVPHVLVSPETLEELCKHGPRFFRCCALSAIMFAQGRQQKKVADSGLTGHEGYT